MVHSQKWNNSKFYYEKELAEKIVSSKSIVIYGARIVAKEVASCLMGDPYNCDIDAFMVTSLAGNPQTLLGRKVMTIQEGQVLYRDSLIIVAVLERYIDEIRHTLHSSGFKNVIILGFESDGWNGLRGNFFRNYIQERGEVYLDIEQVLSEKMSVSYNASSGENISFHLYNVKCHLDKVLSADVKEYPWEIPIQVGAALTDKVISAVRDNTGDNISQKNGMYCELTALYWIWKNDKAEYMGLSHYRRHFELTDKEIVLLSESDIDVVLTIPIMNFPSVRSVYECDHEIEDWDIMLDAIRALCPDYYQTADKLQKGIYYYAYNMFIARREIFSAYCEWLFPILDYCEANCKAKMDKYQNRFLGFLAERLMSVYFIHHKNQWKIVHCKKNFLS